MTERTKSPPPDRSPKAPAMPVPPGACDCHFHFVGPQDRFPIRASSPVEFEDCTMDDYLELQGALGLSRGVLVHGFMQPPSYEYMLHALLREPDRLRGVAYPSINITDQEIEILSRAGVVGQRYNFRNTPQLPMKHVERLIEAGWHAQFLYRGSEECEAWADEIRKTPGTIVIDHMGFPEPQGGLESPAYKFLMEMMESGRCWAKLSQRFSTEKTMPFADA
ncbi:MAG: amidohydrolase family protein, partial [Rhodospirillales bacterium]|nr:amidohydrolase family protein [Rhodospirillales bacterium]